MSFRSRLNIALLVFGLSLLMPRDALALWGWIEQLSGPGPFTHSSEFLVGQLVCVENGNREQKVVSIFNGDRQARVNCLTDSGRRRDSRGFVWVTAELSFGRSDHNDLFGAARDQKSLQVGYLGVKPQVFVRPGFTNNESVNRVLNVFDVGAGIGLNHFSGHDLAGQSYDLWKTSIPVRLYVTPARLLDKAYWLRALFYGAQVDFYPGGFNAADFHAPGDWKSDSPDVVRSHFLGLDILKLFGRAERQ